MTARSRGGAGAGEGWPERANASERGAPPGGGRGRHAARNFRAPPNPSPPLSRANRPMRTSAHTARPYRTRCGRGRKINPRLCSAPPPSLSHSPNSRWRAPGPWEASQIPIVFRALPRVKMQVWQKTLKSLVELS